MTNVYTPEVITTLTADYVGAENDAQRAEVVKTFAQKLEVTVPSVRGKLVSEGVYIAKVKATTGSGTSKDSFANAVRAMTGLELRSATKMTRNDLEALATFLTSETA